MTELTTPVLVEACVDSLESSRIATEAGAGRLELCVNLDVGGTTPPRALVRAVRAAVSIPVNVMIRPRGGSYIHTPEELASMHGAIDDALEDGASGIVVGVLDSSNRIDERATRELTRRAGSMPVTFHRAFDEVDDQLAALDTLIGAGVARVLTGGGRGTALGGASRLRQLVTHARGRVSIMAGGKVRPDNARTIVDQSGLSELHARSELDPSRIRGIIAALSSAI